MGIVYRQPLTARQIKDKAREFGADLTGIADGAALEANPPDPAEPRRPSDLTSYDGGKAIVLAKRLNWGTTRLVAWNERHKFYNDEMALTELEQTALRLSLWLEDQGYPALMVPPAQVEPARYSGDPTKPQKPLLSPHHAAVEAGLGTLGLNLQLITPEYGPRILLMVVLSSVEVEADRRMEAALCHGPACGRCLKACPGDAVGQWERDFVACERYRSPHGYHKMIEYLDGVVKAGEPDKQMALLRSEDSFNLWQSMLRGVGVVTGCRRCADVCPVGEDYEPVLQDALEIIAEDSPEKELRLAKMVADESAGIPAPGYTAQLRWIGQRSPGQTR